MTDLRDLSIGEDCLKRNADVLGDTLDRVSDKKVSKYHNVKTEALGRVFDSGREAARAQELQLLEKAGEIFALSFQVRIPIAEKVTYICDFCYLDKDLNPHFEEVKGFWTDVAKLKRKLFEEKYKKKLEII